MAGMREEEFETAIKVVVVGNGNVGKSSMIQRYCKGIFTKDYKKTIGVDFLERQLEVDGEDVRLMLWDTAGQEEFDAITKAYYRGAQVCVLAFSTIDRDSFQAIERWKQKVEEEVGSIVMVLVQNKIDLLDEAAFEASEAEELAKRLRLKFFRTSVKDDFNVHEVFKYLAQKYMERLHNTDTQDTTQRRIGQPADGVSGGSANSASRHADSQPGTKTSNANSGGFKIKPNKQRTGGKKHKFCSLA